MRVKPMRVVRIKPIRLDKQLVTTQCNRFVHGLPQLNASHDDIDRMLYAPEAEYFSD